MKVYFDIFGSLNVEAENSTESLALRTWTGKFSDGQEQLNVTWDVPKGPREPGNPRAWVEYGLESREITMPPGGAV